MTEEERLRLTTVEVQASICLDALQAITIYLQKSALDRSKLRDILDARFLQISSDMLPTAENLERQKIAEATILFICGLGRDRRNAIVRHDQAAASELSFFRHALPNNVIPNWWSIAL